MLLPDTPMVKDNKEKYNRVSVKKEEKGSNFSENRKQNLQKTERRVQRRKRNSRIYRIGR